MIIAVDSSALIAIFKNERTGGKWLDFLLGLRGGESFGGLRRGLVRSSASLCNLETLERNMSAVGVTFSPLDQAAAFEAGRLFVLYRKRGGGRSRMIPDLMIAGHALRHGASLATADRDFMSAQFPQLKILQP